MSPKLKLAAGIIALGAIAVTVAVAREGPPLARELEPTRPSVRAPLCEIGPHVEEPCPDLHSPISFEKFEEVAGLPPATVATLSGDDRRELRALLAADRPAPSRLIRIWNEDGSTRGEVHLVWFDEYALPRLGYDSRYIRSQHDRYVRAVGPVIENGGSAVGCVGTLRGLNPMACLSDLGQGVNWKQVLRELDILDVSSHPAQPDAMRQGSCLDSSLPTRATFSVRDRCGSRCYGYRLSDPSIGIEEDRRAQAFVDILWPRTPRFPR